MKLFPILFLLLGTVAFVSGIFVRQKKEANSRLFIALMVAGGICIVVSIVWSGFIIGHNLLWVWSLTTSTPLFPLYLATSMSS